MLYKTFRTPCLALVASLLLAPGCATTAPTFQVFPPAGDLEVKPKPKLAPEALNSEAALDAHDIALEAWGEEGWKAVGRICRWAETNGMKNVNCPKPDS